MDTSGLQPVTLMSECFKDSPVVNLHCEKGPNMGMVEDFDIYQRPNDADLSDNSVTAENEGEERSPKLASKPGFNASSDKLVTNNNTEVSAVAEEIVQPANFSNCNGSITTESAAESISTYSRSCEQVDQLEDTDDFGDFADFTCGTEESPALPEEKNADRIEHSNDFDDAGWADFASADVSMTDKIEEVEVVSIDYLSEPSGSGLPRTTVAHQQGEEEFGDFQDDREIPTGSQVQDSSYTPALFDAILNDVFNVDSIEEASQLNLSSLGDIEKSEESLLNRQLWVNLRCIEESLALKCVWNDSKAQKLHFDVLNVNPAMSQLKNANLPAYASQLGSVLTPLKAAEELTEETASKAIIDATIPAVQSTSATAIPFGSSAVQDSLSVPPVEFDWQGSGLKNPLRDGNAVQGVLLDLDFLDYSAATGDSALSKDLERLGLEANDVLMKSSSPSAQSISQIDNLLAQAAVSSDNSTSQRLKKFGNGKVVNQEVVSILGKLPDLSFMLNPILSFPVKYAGTDNESVMAQSQIQVFSQQKPVASGWDTTELGLSSPRPNTYVPIRSDQHSEIHQEFSQLSDQPLALKLSPATSGRSSVSTPDQQPWASFEDSDVEGEIRSRSPGTEHLNLLEHSVDEDQNSVDNASLASDDDPFSISDTLRQYYTNCFTNLQEKIYKSKDLNAAIPGSHPETMAFFEKSNIPRDELSHIWNLSDINQDGFLNLGEFCTAMHLSVLRVKSNIAVPENLPPHLIPRYTPPRNTQAEVLHSDSESSGTFYPTNFGDIPDGVAKSKGKSLRKPAAVDQSTHSHGPKISGHSKSYDQKYTTEFVSSENSATASPQLKQFTNVIPISRDQDIIHPVPLKMSPENTLEEGHMTAYGKGRTVSEPPQAHEEIFSGKLVRPRTQTTEGFPPVGPQMPQQHQLASKTVVKPAPVNPGANQSTIPMSAGHKSPSRYPPVSNVSGASGGPKPPLLSPKDQPPPPPPPRPMHKHYRSSSLDLNPKDLGPQKLGPTAPPPAPPPRISPHGPIGDTVALHHGFNKPLVGLNNSVGPEVTPRSRVVDSQTQTEFGDLTDVGLDRKRRSSAPMLELTIDTLLSEDVNGDANELDWKERCARLARVNEELEKQLAELTEKRIVVETELRELLAK